ncbi:MAG TPA: peptidyl-prolyl cis-trans isomerase [Pyrinomonadaceae bacterium]|nr:peptidyl-prolyl cis-trans isomerase [Pyrinomonadaceae bacterium]
MLKQISRMKRANKYVLVIFAGLMGLSLVFFYAPSRNQGLASAASNNEVLARVRGDEVTVGDLNRQKEAYQQQFGGQISLAQLGLNDRSMLNGMIRGKIVAQEAERLGLAASDAEVAAKIREQFKDPSGKFVGIERYRDSVTARFGSVARFEDALRDEIAAEKLRAFVTAGVTVGEKEVEEDWRRKNTVFDLTYAAVSADKLAARFEPSEEELQKYFEEHKAEFRFLEPQKKIRYLFIDQNKAGAKLNISDADLRAAYDQIKPENKVAGVKAQQIVLKVADPKLDATVLEKATRLAAELRGGGASLVVPAEKFAEVARGNSEDPATARNGGWLPAPVRQRQGSKDPAVQQVFQLVEGQINDPVKYGDTYYIFRRGESIEKTFEEAKPELLVSQRNTRGYRAAAELAARVAARLKETKDFQKVAQEFAAEANMTPAEMIRETPFVKPGDNVPNIGSNPTFEEAIKPLENAGDIGDRVAISNGFAVPALVEKREPRIPDLSEVREQVVGRVRQERARSQLEETAKELANAATPAALKAAAEKLGLKTATLPQYRISTPIEEAGTSPEADEAILALKEGEVSRRPVKMGDTWLVVAADKRKDPDPTEFAAQRDQLTESMLSTRRSNVFEDYVAEVKARLERENQIRINEDVLKRAGTADALEAPDLP